MKLIGIIKYNNYSCYIGKSNNKIAVFLRGKVLTKSENICGYGEVNTIANGYFTGCNYYKLNDNYVLTTLKDSAVLNCKFGNTLKLTLKNDELEVINYNRTTEKVYNRTLYKLMGGD